MIKVSGGEVDLQKYLLNIMVPYSGKNPSSLLFFRDFLKGTVQKTS